LEFGELLPALNDGQIYSTLARLERGGLVEGESVEGDSRRKRVYALTEAGRAVLARWIETPVPGTRMKDEFFMKFVVLTSTRLAEPRALLERQRREYLQWRRDLDGCSQPTARASRPSCWSRARCCTRRPIRNGWT
jgi:DNA-binding PadR family transcriptional regulator